MPLGNELGAMLIGAAVEVFVTARLMIKIVQARANSRIDSTHLRHGSKILIFRREDARSDSPAFRPAHLKIAVVRGEHYLDPVI